MVRCHGVTNATWEILKLCGLTAFSIAPPLYMHTCVFLTFRESHVPLLSYILLPASTVYFVTCHIANLANQIYEQKSSLLSRVMYLRHITELSELKCSTRNSGDPDHERLPMSEHAFILYCFGNSFLSWGKRDTYSPFLSRACVWLDNTSAPKHISRG